MHKTWQQQNDEPQPILDKANVMGLKELLALKLGEVMHYRSTCGNYDHARQYDRMIEAIHVLLEPNSELMPLSP